LAVENLQPTLGEQDFFLIVPSMFADNRDCDLQQSPLIAGVQVIVIASYSMNDLAISSLVEVESQPSTGSMSPTTSSRYG